MSVESQLRDETGRDVQSASFKQSYENVDALISSKLRKISATKNLMLAEAKVNQSALLLSGAIVLAILALSLTVWLGINLAIGLAIYQLTALPFATITISILMNAILAYVLYFQLKKVWRLVGFKETLQSISEDK